MNSAFSFTGSQTIFSYNKKATISMVAHNYIIYTSAFNVGLRSLGTLTAHEGYHLPLLPSRPGGIHEPPLRKTQVP